MRHNLTAHLTDIKTLFGLSVLSLGRKQPEKQLREFVAEVSPQEELVPNKVVEVRNRQTEILNLMMRLTSSQGETSGDMNALLGIMRKVCLNTPQDLPSLKHNMKKSILRAVLNHSDLCTAFSRFEEACNVFIPSLLSYFRANYADEAFCIEFQEEFERLPISINVIIDQSNFNLLKMPESWAIAVECRLDDFRDLLSALHIDKDGNFQVNVLYIERISEILEKIPVNAKNKARLLKAAFFEIAERIFSSSLEKELSQGQIGVTLEKIKQTLVGEFIIPMQDFVEGLSFQNTSTF